MEPNTDSIMQNHFVVDNDSVCGFRSTICLGTQSHRRDLLQRLRRRSGNNAGSHVMCARELIYRAGNVVLPMADIDGV
jgi:hypothetical protein